MNKSIMLGAMILFVAACDSTGPGSGGRVAVKFSSAAVSGVSANVVTASELTPSSDLTVTGTNGSLVIDDIRFIVEELKLRSSASTSACADDENENEVDDDLRVSADDKSGSNSNDDNETDDDCEFKGGPFIVDLPLDGNATITTANVPAGTYDSFKFKIDDLEADDQDDDNEVAKTPSLLTEMRTAYPNFPSRASMVVHGTQNGTPFTVYFRSKIRVRQAISPPLVVPGDQVLTVHLDPSMWFKVGNQVLNLAALDGKLADLGTFKNGIKSVHHGDD
jgi:hypothetical protein